MISELTKFVTKVNNFCINIIKGRYNLPLSIINKCLMN